MWDPLLRDLASDLAEHRVGSRSDDSAAADPTAALCPECEGRGWVLVDDGGAGTARPCTCRQDGSGDQLRTAAGISKRYHRCRMASFKTSVPDHGASRQLQEQDFYDALLAEERRDEPRESLEDVKRLLASPVE